MSLRVYLRDRDNRRMGEIDDFQHLSYTRKWRGVGNFTLSMSPDSSIARFWEPRTGILIYEDDKIVFSGPLTSMESVREGDEQTLDIIGTDDNVLLRDRLATPDNPPYTLRAYYSRIGTAEAVIKAIVAFNLAKGEIADLMAPNGLASRKGPVELYAVEARGDEIVSSARFEQLDEHISELCLIAGDWGWSVRQGYEGADPTQLIFDTHQMRTVVDSVRFSVPLGNVAGYSYRLQRPTANYVVVAGQGELTGRTFREGGDPASIERWGLIEGPLRDRRDATEARELLQTRDEELTLGAEKTSVSFKVSDTDSQKYGRSWFLGDVVTTAISDVEFYEAVREVTVDYTPGADREVSVVIGTPDAQAPEVLDIFAAQRDTLKRASALERRK